MDEHRINFLSDKIVKGTITEAEMKEFNDWYAAYDNQEQEVRSALDKDTLGARLYSQIAAQAKDLESSGKKRIALWQRISAAAAILIMIGTGILFYKLSYKTSSSPNQQYASDISPGVNQATLILANGKKIILNNTANGQLAKQSGVTINKTRNGEIIYTAHATPGAPVQYNTLVTARGEQYQVILPDGSHVWLNAASSLKYPTAFTGHERTVVLTGEAYFEVAHNQALPFHVNTDKQDVQVLGTHFNINTYADEPLVKTTLLQGLVKLNANHTSQVLKPGQQAVLKGGDLMVSDVDTDLAVAWKNGEFSFKNEALPVIMRKVARWYNVEIAYQDSQITERTFSGTVSRFDKVSKVLRILELTGDVHFRIDHQKIIVSK